MLHGRRNIAWVYQKLGRCGWNKFGIKLDMAAWLFLIPTRWSSNGCEPNSAFKKKKGFALDQIQNFVIWIGFGCSIQSFSSSRQLMQTHPGLNLQLPIPIADIFTEHKGQLDIMRKLWYVEDVKSLWNTEQRESKERSLCSCCWQPTCPQEVHYTLTDKKLTARLEECHTPLNI